MKTRNTLKTSIIAALMITVFAAAAAQAQAEQTETVRNSLTGGSWSMQFRISEDFSLSSFEGSTISLKKHFTDKSALRLGVSVSHSDRNNNAVNHSQEEEYFQDDRRDTSWTVSETEPGNLDVSDFSQSAAGVSAIYVYYPAPTKKINAYLGLGPAIRYSHRSSHNSRDYPTAYNRIDSSAYLNRSESSDSDNSSWSYGADFVCGAEWFAASNISFIAEYSLGASFTKTSDTRITTSQRTEYRGDRLYDKTSVQAREFNDNKWSIHDSRVRFGISVYF